MLGGGYGGCVITGGVPVRAGQHHHIGARVEPVHLHQQLVQCALALRRLGGDCDYMVT